VRTRYHKGFPVREWIRRSGVRNEPLDCRVYAYAALCSLNVQWQRLSKRVHDRRAKEAEPEAPAVESPPPTEIRLHPVKPFSRAAPRRSGWVKDW